jgi:hypothetical protein
MCASASSQAHDIPSDVTLQAFLKPEGRTLRLALRVPMGALRDIDAPRRGPGYLDLPRAEPALRDAARMWLAEGIEVYEDGVRLAPPRVAAVRVSLPSDPGFATYEDALAHLAAPPLPPQADLYWEQGVLDVLFEYPIASADARFAIRPLLERLGARVVVALRFLPPRGGVRAYELDGDPGLVVLDPRWSQAALRFVELGFLHILGGIDHLLFLLCLVIPCRGVRPLVVIISSFTLAHSITLAAAALDFAPQAQWFPPLVETLIAASIVAMALENILAPRPRHRAALAFAFGLVHGFGFSAALQQKLQFAGTHLLTSLFSFNIGIELGQLLVLALLVPALQGLLLLVRTERPGTIVLSALVAHTGWHWMLERGERLLQFPLRWPGWSAALAASALRWVMLAVVAAGVAWLVLGVLMPAMRTAEAKD